MLIWPVRCEIMTKIYPTLRKWHRIFFDVLRQFSMTRDKTILLDWFRFWHKNPFRTKSVIIPDSPFQEQKPLIISYFFQDQGRNRVVDLLSTYYLYEILLQSPRSREHLFLRWMFDFKVYATSWSWYVYRAIFVRSWLVLMRHSNNKRGMYLHFINMLASIAVKHCWTELLGIRRSSNENVHLDKLLIKD